MGGEAGRAPEPLRAEHLFVVALGIVDLHPSVAAVSDVEFGLGLAAVDPDGVRAGECAGFAFLAVDACYVVAGLVVA